MAVGKGSMARAAKAAGKETAPAEETAGKSKTAVQKEEATVKKTTAKKTAAKTAAAEVIAAPSGEVLQQIVYQECSGVLERAAGPNEIFGLGDAMPVYYL